MERIINKNTYASISEIIDCDDIVVTNDIADDTANIRVIATDEEFENASNYNLLNYFKRVK